MIKLEPVNAKNICPVNAEDICTYLEIKTDFSKWIQEAIKKYNFVKNEDYTTYGFFGTKGYILKNPFKCNKLMQDEYKKLIDRLKNKIKKKAKQ